MVEHKLIRDASKSVRPNYSYHIHVHISVDLFEPSHTLPANQYYSGTPMGHSFINLAFWPSAWA